MDITVVDRRVQIKEKDLKSVSILINISRMSVLLFSHC